MTLLNTKHFKRLTTDPTAATEGKTQKTLKNLNSQSKNTKDYTQQAQHQLNLMVQPSYTS